MKDQTAQEFIKNIKIGWNLGNTLDAWSKNANASVLEDEMGWHNVVTTEEMVIKIKEAGFNLFRVPVSWWKHLNDDHSIKKEWIDRVSEVVDYGIKNGMYVILNMHHENWHFPSYENYEKAKERLAAVWTQIGNRFSAYDEHLIFEAMNEPRMVGTPLEWSGGNEEARDVINRLNSVFIETIRSLGGNNSLRQLMIPTYAANGEKKTTNDFKFPEDKRVIVSIHSYTPYDFALNIKPGSSTKWDESLESDRVDIDNLFLEINETFTAKGVPVILGEFGATNKDNLSSRVEWAKYFVSKAKEYGVPCCWWDNGVFSGDGELFGIFDRKNLSWKYSDIVEAMTKLFS